jgi:hypothetical protein
MLLLLLERTFVGIIYPTTFAYPPVIFIYFLKKDELNNKENHKFLKKMKNHSLDSLYASVAAARGQFGRAAADIEPADAVDAIHDGVVRLHTEHWLVQHFEILETHTGSLQQCWR